MKTRLPIFVFALSFVLGTFALAQVSRWDSVSYDELGFVLQLPTGSAKQPIEGLSGTGVCDVYAQNGLAFVVRVTPAPDDLPTSTAIEQAIQAEAKAASKLGVAKRWEQTSKQGDLFKGLIASVQLSGQDPVQAAISKIVGPDSAVECSSMVAVGDDTSPILRLSVIGPSSRQTEVVTTAKGIAAFLNRTQSASKTPSVETPGPNASATAQKPIPAPAAKPWPALKKGEIELAGVVDAVNPDHKSLTLIVDLVTTVGAEPIALSPARSKVVVLKSKLPWLVVGQRIRVHGKNSGVGKPITADVLEQAPEKKPTNAPSRTRGPITV